jgi:ATP-binding cassette subfamily B protein
VVHRAAGSGTTVILIAHRLTTVRAADRIVVLERGRVVEEGGHDALMLGGGQYARLWEHNYPAVAGRLAAAG